MNKATAQKYVSIPKEEYVHLTTLARRFGVFWNYFKHLKDIESARKEVKAKKIISQKKCLKN